jgi:REP element-mobilizing transposase RayT
MLRKKEFMSIHNIWIHLVFSTKKRNPLLTKSIRQAVFHHMFDNAKSKGINMDFVNGYYDHAHCLFRLPAIMTLAEAAQLIKGESSHWVNQTGLTDEHFEWQNQYYASSVSPKLVDNVRNYIKNQEEHHKDVSFEKEIEKLGYNLIDD